MLRLQPKLNKRSGAFGTLKMLKYFAVFCLITGVFVLNIATTMGHTESHYVEVGDLHYPRSGHTSTLLDDGRVLIIGGAHVSGFHMEAQSAEIYDPKKQKFTKLPEMKGHREDHTATKLKDGHVLILGGHEGPGFSNLTQIVEIFDPKTNTFQLTTPFPKPIAYQTATLLQDGRVAIVYEDEVYLYDPQTDSFKLWGKLSFRRREQSAVLLADGRLLVVGGIGMAVPTEEAHEKLPIGEIIDFKNNNISNVHYTMMIGAYYRNPMFLLKDNRVFLCNTESAYIFSADGTQVERIKVANIKREKLLQGVLLPNGNVLLVGNEFWPEVPTGSYGLFESSWKNAKTGPVMSELYDPETGEITEAGPPKIRRPEDYAMTVLKDGSVLITGGRFYPRKAELYRP